MPNFRRNINYIIYKAKQHILFGDFTENFETDTCVWDIIVSVVQTTGLFNLPITLRKLNTLLFP